MASEESSAEVKQRLVQQLRETRSELQETATQAKEEYNPVAIVSRSMESHKLLWTAAGVVGGLILIRLVLPPKNRSDISSKSAKTRGFSGLLRGVAFSVAQRAAIQYAQHYLQQSLQTPTLSKDIVSSVLQSPGPRS